MVKARGHKVVYLGQSLPLADLAEVHKIYHADVVMTAITSKPSMEDVPEYLDAMFQKIPGASFWVTGAQAVGCTKVSSNRCTIIQTIAHLKEMLSQYD